MLAFPVTLISAAFTTALVLWMGSRWLLRCKLSLALAAGSAAGSIAWVAMNELGAAESTTGFGEIVEATFSTFTSPREAAHWFVPIVLVAGIASWLVDREQRDETATRGTGARRNWLPALMWTVIYGGALVRLLWGSVYLTRQWSVSVATITVVGHVAALLFVFEAGRNPTTVRSLAIRLSLITAVTGAACAVIGMSGSAVYAQLCATTGAALLVSAGSAFWNRSGGILSRVPIGMILLVVGYHLWLAHFFAELTLVDGGLLLAALASAASYCWSDPCGTWLTRVLPVILSAALSLAAVAHAGFTLLQTLAKPLGY